jgi:hypothetical protein
MKRVIAEPPLPEREGRERQEARAQEVDAGAAVRLASQRLQAIDVAFDWAVAPRLRDRAFDRAQVLLQGPDEPLQRKDVGRGRGCQPVVQCATVPTRRMVRKLRTAVASS